MVTAVLSAPRTAPHKTLDGWDAGCLVRGTANAIGQTDRRFTRREQEVAEPVAHGRTNRQIADELFLSTTTVESHLARIFETLRFFARGHGRRVQHARR